MKKSSGKNGKSKKAITPEKLGNIQEEKKYFDNNRSSLAFSTYSFVNSNFQSSLNTIASVILVTDSALAFTGISLSLIKIISISMSLYLISVLFYIFFIMLNMNAKKIIVNLIKNNINDINMIINKIENAYRYNFIIVMLIVLFSCVFLVSIIDIFPIYTQ